MTLNPLKAKSGGGESFEVPPSGNHPGVLIAIIDLGTQNSEYQGVKREAHEIFMCWELTDQIVSGTKDRHHLIGKRFTYSFHSKAGLRQLIEKWRGRAYKDDDELNPIDMLGKPCLVNVSNSQKEDRIFAKFEGVGPLPKSMTCPPAQHKVVAWEVESGDIKALEWLPWCYGSKIADIVMDSPEWKERARGGNASTSVNGNGNGHSHTAQEQPVEEESADEDSIPF